MGRFVLSINDMPDVRRIFSGFAMAEENVTYSVGGNNGHVARELVITGAA